MPTMTKFHALAKNLLDGEYDLDADTLNVCLTNTAPTQATDANFSDISEISAGSGYTAGGATVANTSTAQDGDTSALFGDDVAFTASGGPIGPFRYAVLYDDTHASDAIIGYWDYGSTLTLADGESLTIVTDAVNGIMDLS